LELESTSSAATVADSPETVFFPMEEFGKTLP
jgi:hypothetical protein